MTSQQLATTNKGSDVLVSGATLHAAMSGAIMAAKKILSLLPLAVNSKLIK
jgi:molybdenum cofactor biosynthesis enzyme